MERIADKGMMGVGTLIIFIAVILVAAVAAAVLISVAGSLQQKSLTTGGQAQEGVATGAEGISVMGLDASYASHNVDQFEVLLRLQAGSEPLNLNNTVIVLDTSTTSQNLDYYGDATTAYTTKHYGVEYVKSGPDQEDGYLSRGDVLKVMFNSTNGVGQNQRVRIKVIPRIGQPTIIEFTTPDVMTDQRITLWP
jgi:archaeal flagellin FlaB